MVQAVQHVRRMRGGAQAHLMRCTDDHYYVVKFQNNPQHVRVLANELLASKLAEQIGLPVPPCDLVDVSHWLVHSTDELRIEQGLLREPCMPGLCFGSRYVADPEHGPWQAMDYVPDDQFVRVQNLNDFAGVLCLDKWTSNANGRQAVFVRAPRRRYYHAMFIDFGYCFNAGEWNFPDSPLRGVFSRNAVYADVKGWASFEPWLTRLEHLPASAIGGIASHLPPEWCGDWDELHRLLDRLFQRRFHVRDLITAFRKSSRSPFPQWTEERVTVM